MRFVTRLCILCIASASVSAFAQTNFTIRLVGKSVYADGEIPRQYLFRWIARHYCDGKLEERGSVQEPIVDDFPGAPLKFSKETHDADEFLDRIRSIQGFWAYGPHPKSRAVVFVNMEPISVGEVQVFADGGTWHLEAKDAPVPSIMERVSQVLGTVPDPIPSEAAEKRVTLSIRAESDEVLLKKLNNWIDDQKPSPGEPAKVSDSWQLTFTYGESVSYAGGAFKTPEYQQKTATLIATALNDAYGDKTVTVAGNTLLIHGKKQTVFEIKEALAKWIDVPYEQVRLDLWVFRASERKDAEKKLSERISLVRRGIAVARAYQKYLVAELEDELRVCPFRHDLTDFQIAQLIKLYPKFGLANPLSTQELTTLGAFENGRDYIRPTIDCLSYIPFLDGEKFSLRLTMRVREKKSAAFLRTAREQINQIDAPVKKGELDVKKELLDLVTSFDKTHETPFNLTSSLVSACSHQDGDALLNYLDAYNRCDARAIGTNSFVEPGQLSLVASSADTLIGNTVDAVTADMRRTVVEPLQSWIDRVSKDGSKDYLSVNGQTTINVTSSMSAGSFNVGQSFAPYTGPSNLGSTGIQSIADGLKGEALTSSAGVLAFAKVLAGLTPTATTFTKLENGLSMSVRPTVLPGGRAARLQIDVASTIDVAKASGDFNAAEGRLDNLKVQHLITDVQVDAFDLFELSTLSLDNTGPGDYRWQIPFLDGLPLIGGAFRGPRSTLTTAHRAMVLVQVTIVPKSLQITRRYVKGL